LIFYKPFYDFMLFSISIEGEQPKTVSIDQEIFTIGGSPKASIQVEKSV